MRFAYAGIFMKTSLFDFHLPQSLIAVHPANPRDNAKMLVIGDALQDRLIHELPQFLQAGDVMVFNDTRVIPARLLGRRRQARVEVLLHKLSPPNGGVRYQTPRQARGLWQCFAKPAKRLKPGDRVDFAEDFYASVMEKLPSGEIVLAFDYSPAQMHSLLAQYGHMPLPPYIERLRHADASDHEHYQTVYARHEGSVAAPTAGLHFTEALLADIDAVSIQRAHVTLHVGGGTFLPVKVEDTDDHIMHSEYAEITPEAAEIINQAKARGGRVIAVGTTSLRTLESAADDDGKLHPFQDETAIFITPGYRFKIVDMLLTNFHLPRSTLFMLVSAFSGLERMQTAYAYAISSGYRFYSYGDACLLYPQKMV